MDNQALRLPADHYVNNLQSEEVFDPFLCCICLDLLYKPIVLSCGHVSCFWCVHRSMNTRRESHCPICRHPYNHFPSICLMFHLLLSKMYPIAYKRREKQILEEEKKRGSFSPQLESHSCGPRVDKELDHLGDSAQSSTIADESTGEGGFLEIMEHLGSGFLNNGTAIPVQISGETVSNMEKNSPENKLNANRKQIAVTDVLCSACEQLLVHPVVLNCGHVYCETCIIKANNGKIRCQICQCLSPTGCPKVCLELDHFLKERFSKEYTSRIDAVQPRKLQLNHESATTGSMAAGKLGFFTSLLPTGEQPMWADPRSKIHCGVGCDYCGMYPIIGDRYRCKDCLEAIGFDLCGDCYNTCSKLPGRFNQQHTPEHRLELVKTSYSFNVIKRLVTGHLEEGSPALILADDIFGNGSPVTLSGDAQQNTGDDSPGTVTIIANRIDESESEPSS